MAVSGPSLSVSWPIPARYRRHLETGRLLNLAAYFGCLLSTFYIDSFRIRLFLGFASFKVGIVVREVLEEADAKTARPVETEVPGSEEHP